MSSGNSCHCFIEESVQSRLNEVERSSCTRVRSSRIFGRFARDMKYFKIAIDNFDPVVHIHIKMSKQLDMAKVENCVCFNLRWVARAVTQFYDSEMRRHGIRPTQGTILLALKSKENWSMADLSDWLGRSEEHTSELQSHSELVCRLLLEKKK